MSAETDGRVGFYGKLPSHGDFVRWGLSRELVAAWDVWLQGVWCAWRDEAASLGCWRFAIAPGLCGPRRAAGVLMPSADKVGRRFPLLLAVEGGGADEPLLDALTRAGRAAIDDAASRDELMSRLQPLQATLASNGEDPTGAACWWRAGAAQAGEWRAGAPRAGGWRGNGMPGLADLADLETVWFRSEG